MQINSVILAHFQSVLGQTFDCSREHVNDRSAIALPLLLLHLLLLLSIFIIFLNCPRVVGVYKITDFFFIYISITFESIVFWWLMFIMMAKRRRRRLRRWRVGAACLTFICSLLFNTTWRRRRPSSPPSAGRPTPWPGLPSSCCQVGGWWLVVVVMCGEAAGGNDCEVCGPLVILFIYRRRFPWGGRGEEGVLGHSLRGWPGTLPCKV